MFSLFPDHVSSIQPGNISIALLNSLFCFHISALVGEYPKSHLLDTPFLCFCLFVRLGCLPIQPFGRHLIISTTLSTPLPQTNTLSAVSAILYHLVHPHPHNHLLSRFVAIRLVHTPLSLSLSLSQSSLSSDSEGQLLTAEILDDWISG